MDDALDIEVHTGGAGHACAEILGELPDWFGIPESNADYVETAEREPTVVASIDARAVGLLTMVRHSDDAAEVYLMAVRPALHRQGIGLRMLNAAEKHLQARGVTYLQVKTLAADSPDPNYAKTRAFYQANGFVTLEVFPTLWDPSNPALQMIKTLGS